MNTWHHILVIVLVATTARRACLADLRPGILDDADRHIRAFRQTHAIDELRLAKSELGDSSDEARAIAADASVRAIAEHWITFFSAVDGSIDPTFDPNDSSQLGSLSVSPPREASGVSLPAGVPASAVKDPIARAAYRREIRLNEAKILRTNRQAELRTLAEEATHLFRAVVRHYVSFTPTLRPDLIKIVSASSLLPTRKAQLLTIVRDAPPGPLI